jgi:hypothetical protein
VAVTVIVCLVMLSGGEKLKVPVPVQSSCAALAPGAPAASATPITPSASTSSRRASRIVIAIPSS